MMEQEFPHTSWMKGWFKNCCRSEWTETPHQFFQLLRLLQKLKIQIDSHWLNRWAAQAPDQIKKLSVEDDVAINDLLHIADFIVLAPVCNHSVLMSVWFEKLHLAHNSINDDKLKHVFHQLNKIDVDVPNLWISDFSNRMSSRFKSLTVGEIIHILFSFACHGVSVETVRSFLEKSRIYFLKGENCLLWSSSSKKNLIYFREALIAQNYFKMLGFDIGLKRLENHIEYETVKDTLKNEIFKQNERKLCVFEYIKKIFPNEVKNNNWQSVIMQNVECCVESKRLIIEIYNNIHFINSKLKKRIKIKHILLENDGYTILHFNLDDLSENWENDILQKIQPYK
jgi:very-short-patch-repair endonuclease